MTLFLTVLETTAPVFLLSLIGFVWVKLDFEYRVQFVTRLATSLAVPCLIFVALMRTDVDPQALATISIAAAVAYGLVGTIVVGLVFLAGLSSRTFTAPMIFGNTGNIGLPLALFAFGDIGLDYAVVVFAVMVVFSFTFGVWLVSEDSSPLAVVREPLVGATVLGGLFLWRGWETPAFLTNTFELIGQMAIPLMLITLGVAVGRLKPGRLSQAMALSAVKLTICLPVAWFTGRFFALDPVAFSVLVLQICTPVAVTAYLLAEKYGADSDAVAGLVVTSTLLSIAALPLLLAVLI